MHKYIYNLIARSWLSTFFVIPICLFFFIKQNKVFLSKKKKILVINSTKFTDLPEIKKNSEFDYYILSTSFMLRLLSPWFHDLNRDKQFDKYGDRVAFIKNKHEFFYNKRIAIRKFHKKVLLNVIKLLKIKCVFSPGVHYITDADLGYVCENNNIPFVAFHKECLLMTKKQQDISYSFFSKIYDYKASLVFVFNDVVKNILEKCDIGIKQVITAAPPRLNDMNKIFSKNYEKKKIVFFSFSPNHAVPGPMNPVQSKKEFNFDFKWKNLFFHTHLEFLRLADNYVNEDFLIKFKGRLKKFDAEEELRKLYLKKYNKKFPKNLEIVYDEANPFEEIKKAKIFISFNSTCIIETGLLDVPIIVPNYYEANNEYKDLSLFSKYTEEYEIVNEPDQFYKSIEKHILNKKFKLNENIKEKRIKLFNKYLANRYVDYSKDYESHIKKLIN